MGGRSDNFKENKYVFFRKDQRTQHYEFDPNNPACLDNADYKYFGRVLHALEPEIKGLGLTVYVTAWTVHELPSYGPNVVACILQDEWGREPKYREKVGMVFKACGKNPIVPHALGYGDSYDFLSNLSGQAKNLLRDGTGRMRTAFYALQGRSIAPVIEIPLGYYSIAELPFVPFEERTNDLFFAGSVHHENHAGFSIKKPKELARERMEAALTKLRDSHPEIRIKTTVTGSFDESIATDNHSYLHNMMNTRFALVPRGANLETFRFYEAIRYGCIPVGEAFPKAWYYEDAPILRLSKWSDIVKIIPDLLNDPQAMLALHLDTLKWWENLCSEKALAKFMAKKINLMMAAD